MAHNTEIQPADVERFPYRPGRVLDGIAEAVEIV